MVSLTGTKHEAILLDSSGTGYYFVTSRHIPSDSIKCRYFLYHSRHHRLLSLLDIRMDPAGRGHCAWCEQLIHVGRTGDRHSNRTSIYLCYVRSRNIRHFFLHNTMNWSKPSRGSGGWQCKSRTINSGLTQS